MGLMEIRRRILQNGDGLPPAYKRIEYITGVGSGSVVDTGINGNNDNLRFVFAFELNDYFGYTGIFGNYYNEQTDCWRLITMAASTPNGFYITRGRIANASQGLYVTNPSDYRNRKIYVDISRSKASITTDTSTSEKGEATATHGTENNRNIAIGNNTVATGASNARRLKFYYFRIYDSGKLIRNYIPCYRKSDNKVGFYDAVNHTFNPSIGATQFILPEGS